MKTGLAENFSREAYKDGQLRSRTGGQAEEKLQVRISFME